MRWRENTAVLLFFITVQLIYQGFILNQKTMGHRLYLRLLCFKCFHSWSCCHCSCCGCFGDHHCCCCCHKGSHSTTHRLLIWVLGYFQPENGSGLSLNRNLESMLLIELGDGLIRWQVPMSFWHFWDSHFSGLHIFCTNQKFHLLVFFAAGFFY